MSVINPSTKQKYKIGGLSGIDYDAKMICLPDM
jgi:hypothetical protein